MLEPDIHNADSIIEFKVIYYLEQYGFEVLFFLIFFFNKYAATSAKYHK
jgi:hypothetical protein